MKSIFIAGTDTDIGKSFVSAMLAYQFGGRVKTTYFKAVQAGQPTDTDFLGSILSDRINYQPPTYDLDFPMSPNRAAEKQNVEIDIDKITADFHQIDSEVTIVEGAGGLMVPLNDSEMVVDLPLALDIPLVLVASTRLGTINHTLLSLEAIKSRGLNCLGIILNGAEDPGLKELLEQRSGFKVIAEVPLFNEKLNSDNVENFCGRATALQEFVDDFCADPIVPSEDLSVLDKQNVWHPFTQHGIVKKHPVVSAARGSYLDLQGHKVIDAISSWWVNLFGHCEPRLVKAIQNQTAQLEHVLFAGFTHEPAVLLSEKLAELAHAADTNLTKVFFSDNGSTAVEVALKLAYQYQQQIGQLQRTRFLAFKGSYHGDTVGAMSVGEREGFNSVFKPLLFDVDFVDPFDLSEVQSAFENSGNHYAGVIVEPMVQGASGMRMYPVEVLNQIGELASQYQVKIICDEVFTGFYRTGKLFAFEHSKLRPDFLCLSKGLTGGFLPLSVTLTTDSVYDCFYNGDMRQAFLHGHSYTANPIACRVALETLRMLGEPEWQAKVTEITDWQKQFLEEIANHPKIHAARQLGTIAAMEISDEDPNYFKGDFSYRFNQAALKKGVLLRPLGGTVYSVPPYCITKPQLKKVYSTIEELVNQENF